MSPSSHNPPTLRPIRKLTAANRSEIAAHSVSAGNRVESKDPLMKPRPAC